MSFFEAYDINNAEFIGGFCSPDHDWVCENTDEVYFEEMLFKSKQNDDVYMIVNNRWNFFGVYCRVDQTIMYTQRDDAIQWLKTRSSYSNWTEELDELMYDVQIPVEDVYLSTITIE